jgi:hypothetical protein
MFGRRLSSSKIVSQYSKVGVPDVRIASFSVFVRQTGLEEDKCYVSQWSSNRRINSEGEEEEEDEAYNKEPMRVQRDRGIFATFKSEMNDEWRGLKKKMEYPRGTQNRGDI